MEESTKLPKATPEAIDLERRRFRVARMFRMGMTQQEIAAELRIAQSTVSEDLKIVREEWKKHRVMAWDDRLAELAGEIGGVRAEAWQAWDRSLREVETKTTARTSETAGGPEGGESGPEGAVAAAATIRKQRSRKSGVGNPRFLDIILQTVERECRLFGIDAPLKFAQTDPTGQKESQQKTSESETQIALLCELFRLELAKRRGDSPGPETPGTKTS